MNLNEAIFKNRNLGEVGLDLYFYSLRTLMIYNYEIVYQLRDGIWSSSRYPKGHSDPWVKANLHLTQGKNNARNVVEIGCNIIKNNYDLKKILNVFTAYNRIQSIGKLSIILENDVDLLITLLNEGFHEISSFMECEVNEENFSSFIEALRSNGCNRSAVLFTEDLMKDYIECEYTHDMMTDDLGMIQNTMRNTMSLNY